MPEVLVPAQRELAANAVWYDERRPGYGERFLREVRDLFDLIDRMPLVGPPWILPGIPEGVRHVVLRTFPISVVYVTELDRLDALSDTSASKGRPTRR